MKEKQLFMSFVHQCLIFLVMLLFSCPFTVLADEAVPEGDISSKEAVSIVKEEIGLDLPASEGKLSSQKEGIVLNDSTPQDGDKVTLPVQATGEIKMESEGSDDVKIDLPDDGSAGKATAVNSSTVVYPNTGDGVDTVVSVPSSEMIETWHIIRSGDSPQRYEYNVTVPDGGRLKKIDDNNLTIENYEGTTIMTVSAPDAYDANDKDVPLKLEIEDGKIVLYVYHNESYGYPVIADPTYLSVKMNDAEWKYCRLPWNTPECVVAGGVLANEALSKANNVAKKYKWEIHNGGADAFRHCYWSGLMTISLGESEAKGFGNRHEEEPGQPAKEKDMDLNNNKKGREWARPTKKGKQVKKQDIYDKCVAGVKNKDLKYITKKP